MSEIIPRLRFSRQQSLEQRTKIADEENQAKRTAEQVGKSNKLHLEEIKKNIDLLGIEEYLTTVKTEFDGSVSIPKFAYDIERIDWFDGGNATDVLFEIQNQISSLSGFVFSTRLHYLEGFFTRNRNIPLADRKRYDFYAFLFRPSEQPIESPYQCQDILYFGFQNGLSSALAVNLRFDLKKKGSFSQDLDKYYKRRGLETPSRYPIPNDEHVDISYLNDMFGSWKETRGLFRKKSTWSKGPLLADSIAFLPENIGLVDLNLEEKFKEYVSSIPRFPTHLIDRAS